MQKQLQKKCLCQLFFKVICTLFLTINRQWYNFSEKEEHEIRDWLIEESVSCNSDAALLPSCLFCISLGIVINVFTGPSKWQV